MKGFVICVLLVAAIAHLMVEPSNAFTCVDVESTLSQCITYLTGKAPKPAQACCAGVQKLKAMATTTTEKRLACNCVKEAAHRFRNIEDSAVSSLPKECKCPLPFTISTSFDCSQ